MGYLIMLNCRVKIGGRSLSKALGFSILCFATICIFYLFSSVSVGANMPRFDGKFYLQRELDPLISPADGTNDSINLDPLVDKSPSLSAEGLMKDIQKRMPNLPVFQWDKKPVGFNKSCARFPSVFGLEFSNIYWQTLRTSNGTFQLYGAYLDNRVNNKFGPTVRILGMIDRLEPTVVTYCQFWFDGMKQPVIARSSEYKYIWHKYWGNNKQGIYQPYLIACVVPKKYQKRVPQSISLVEEQCDTSTVNLNVIYDKPAQKKDFAVCVKGLDFLHEDISVRLVEWIEILKILGADKVFFYELHAHKNITKVLTHYEQEGTVQVTAISLAGGQPNGPSFQHLYLKKKLIHKRQNELIPYNDCFYKHMYEYKYIALLDIDEVIVPVEGTTWKELMDTVVPKALKGGKVERGSYNARNVYFLDDFNNDERFEEIPMYMYMLQHVYRTQNYTKAGRNIKSFHNTEKVLTLHNHFPMSCLGGSCKNYAIDPNDARMHHYRGDCVKTLKKGCELFRKTRVKDNLIWKFKDSLVPAVSSTLRDLGFLSGANG